MRLFILFALLSWQLLSAYEITSVELSDQATEYPEEQRVEMGKITDRFPYKVPAIHVLLHLKGVKHNDPMTVRWIAVDALPQPDVTLAELEFELNANTPIAHTFIKQGEKFLPPGHYRVEFLKNGKLLASKKFTIYATDERSSNQDADAIIISADIKENSDGTHTPIGVTDHFPTDQEKIHFIIPLKEDVKSGTEYTVDLYAVDVGMHKNLKMYGMSATILSGMSHIHGFFSMQAGPRQWPDGFYEMVAQIGDHTRLKKRFVIGDPSWFLESRKIAPSRIPDEEEKRKMMRIYASHMLKAIEQKNLLHLYDVTIHHIRDRIDWNTLTKSFYSVFNAPVNWRKVFTQEPRLYPVKLDPLGKLTLQARYPNPDGVDILLEGTYFLEDNEWRLAAYSVMPAD